VSSSTNKTKLIWPDSYYAEYFYDELNRLTDIKLNGSGTAAVHFDYDALSRRTLITYENGCTCAYAWEINDDLTDLEHTFDTSAVAWQFSYNKVQQVTSKSVDNSDYAWPSPTAFSKKKYGSANSLNQYPSVQGVAQDYDDNGNLTSGVLTATFDVLNRMTQATLGGTTVDFIYDPNNRQAQKSVSSVDTGFLYDGVQLIAEYDGGTLEKRYIPGVLPDEVLIKIESSTKTYFHKDRLGSVIAVTDASGDVLSSMKYGPFGETPSLTGTPFGYTGQRYDSELQSYYYKARYYSPGIGRFLQPDPIGRGGGINLYSYVGNDAANRLDPSGLAGIMNLTLSGGVDYWEFDPGPEASPYLGPSPEEQMMWILAQNAQGNAFQGYAARYSSGGDKVKITGDGHSLWLPSGNPSFGAPTDFKNYNRNVNEYVKWIETWNGDNFGWKQMNKAQRTDFANAVRHALGIGYLVFQGMPGDVAANAALGHESGDRSMDSRQDRHNNLWAAKTAERMASGGQSWFDYATATVFSAADAARRNHGFLK
jgi:RHS repeat-associated protein